MNQENMIQKLREARKSAGLSQQTVAEALGLPRTAITQIESGNRSISTLELAQLAQLYRRAISDFFDESSSLTEDPLVALYRMEPDLYADKETQGKLAHYLDLCSVGSNLQRLLERSQLNVPPYYEQRTPSGAYEAITQGTRVADNERQRLNIADASIADTAELITGQGVWACGVALPNNISGIFLHHKSIGMAVLVNFKHVRARKRFSYAHEYGHVLMDRGREISISSRDNASELMEKRANAFAAAFLMPADGVRSLLLKLGKGQPSRQASIVFDVASDGSVDAQARSSPGSQIITYQDVAQVAHYFGVSYQATVYRLRSLNVLSQSECSDLLEQYNIGREYLQALQLFDDLEEREASSAADRELISQVAQLALEAFRQEQITKAKLLEIGRKLDIPNKKLMRLAEATRAH
ncbi:MAG: ImmA/IrrE family metallo-endopeptidase [Gammaproteobacteria bacterium]